MLATQYAEYYEISPQDDTETDMAFRNRVADRLRRMGKVIEAHEAYQDERYEESGAVMGGIGAVAQALQGTSYRGDPIGNDIAVGTAIWLLERL